MNVGVFPRAVAKAARLTKHAAAASAKAKSKDVARASAPELQSIRVLFGSDRKGLQRPPYKRPLSETQRLAELFGRVGWAKRSR